MFGSAKTVPIFQTAVVNAQLLDNMVVVPDKYFSLLT
jgi:hypothetical protein